VGAGLYKSVHLPTYGQLLILMIYVVKCDFTLMMSCVSGCAISRFSLTNLRNLIGVSSVSTMTRYCSCAILCFQGSFLGKFCPYVWVLVSIQERFVTQERMVYVLSANRIKPAKNENFKLWMFQYRCFIQVEFIIFLNFSFFLHFQLQLPLKNDCLTFLNLSLSNKNL
jgi:hypothetical protein